MYHGSCACQSGAASTARPAIDHSNFAAHSSSKNKYSEWNPSVLARGWELRLTPETYEVKSQEQLLNFLGKLGATRNKIPEALKRGSGAQMQFNHAQKSAFCQFAYGGPCTGFLYVHYALKRGVVEAQLSAA